MNNNKQQLIRGIQHGMPIALGYFAVAFTLGIAAKKTGLTSFQASFMSAINVTSAGEFAALDVIKSNAPYLEMAFIQIVINIRYLLMSCALSQKLDESTSIFHRLLIPFCVTDEIFGISISVNDKLNPFYTYGAMIVALPGWTLGTYVGVVSGNIMPERLLSAMSVALYGMFIAVILPQAKKDRVVAIVIAISMIASCAFKYMPYLKFISAGLRIIILTVLISLVAAILFPLKEVQEEKTEKGQAINES